MKKQDYVYLSLVFMFLVICLGALAFSAKF